MKRTITRIDFLGYAARGDWSLAPAKIFHIGLSCSHVASYVSSRYEPVIGNSHDCLLCSPIARQGLLFEILPSQKRRIDK